MMRVDEKRCDGCGTCIQVCPLDAISIRKKKAAVSECCSLCGACTRVCPREAIQIPREVPKGAIQCDSCPIECNIQEGFLGACRRYMNQRGRLIRLTPLLSYQQVESTVGPLPPDHIARPLVTAIGAGTTYPDCKPAPYIISGKRGDVDVVTVVTEAPLSYSGVMVKIDTDLPIGEEGAAVLYRKRKVGMVITEQYGAKILSVGGVNIFTGPDGLWAARVVAEIANRNPVRLRIEGGGTLEIQVGRAPLIDGKRPSKMRVGCGSATLGLFAPLLKECADEVIVLDSHITGLLSEHPAGRFLGLSPSGVHLVFPRSTPGRYFGDQGSGWGGTSITNPLDVIDGLDEEVARPQMKVFITETTGQKGAMYELGHDGRFREVPLTEKAKKAMEAISSSCEPSLVSAIYMGGSGGSARAGVARYPIKLTRAVHEGRAVLTVGGAPTFIMPGGGINFLVDVLRVQSGAFYWTPTPATICPVEYTMELREYEKMGGHTEAMRPFEAHAPRALGRVEKGDGA
jgi:NAD-dependent dihydropyrimidine dehydrogenase PreA subunit